MGKKMVGRAQACGPVTGKKSLVLLPDNRFWPAVPVYLIHSAATRAVRKPPLLCIVIGVGRISKMLPLSLRAEVCTDPYFPPRRSSDLSRGGRGLLAPWHGRKVEFSSLTLGSGLP